MIRNNLLKPVLLVLLLSFSLEANALEIFEANLLSNSSSSEQSSVDPDEVLESSVKNYKFDIDVNSNFSLETEDFPSDLPSDYKIKVVFNVAKGASFYMDCDQFSLPCNDSSISFKVGSGRKNEYCSQSNESESKSFFGSECFEKSGKIIMRVDSDNAGNGFSCRVYGKSCEDSSENSKVKALNSNNCGKSTGTKIINGQYASITEFPWAIRLSSYYNGFATSCGGSIIDNQFILTATHCIYKNGQYAKTMYVRAGCITASSCNQVKIVSSYSVHSSYNSNNLKYGYDIAILKLSSPLSYNSRVNSVCLPSKLVPMGYNLKVIGWGFTSPGGSSSSYLKKADMTSVSDSKCYAKTYKILCAIEKTGRSCSGDSGGFVGSIRNSRYEVDGIVSYGFDNCSTKYAKGFTEVYKFKYWIKSTVARM